MKTNEQIEWMPTLEGGKSRKVERPKPPVDKK